MKKLIPEISIVVLIAFLNMLTGCNYYMVNTLKPVPGDNSVVSNALTQPKYFILHHGSNAWHMSDIVIDEGKQELTCTAGLLPPDHMYYMGTNTEGVNRYKVSNGNPTYEVHIYISEYAELSGSQFLVPISAIQKVEVYDKALGATAASYVFGTLGIIAGAFVILMIILLLTKSSCPFVYISDGNSFHFTGEMYGGAIYSPLERDDFMPLPGFTAVNSQYKLKISNELLERQYTDLAELMIVQHTLDSEVLIDKQGDVQTVRSPLAPVKAVAENSTDYTNPLSARDSLSYLFNEEASNVNGLNTLTLSFKKPTVSKSAKLVLNAKNSFWLDYMYGKFNEQFGTSFAKFSENQKTAPAERMNAWQLSQGIPLSVYIETETGWQFVDCFNSVGPLASRDMVMPVDVSQAKGENVNIRLSCGFMFWEVDYAAMDFSENIPVKVIRQEAKSAVDEKGNDVAEFIRSSDKKYLVQPEVGNEVIVTYPATASVEGLKQTVFLHSRGYYEYIREYTGKPDVAYLKSFRKEGAFAKFSKERYQKFVADKHLIANALGN